MSYMKKWKNCNRYKTWTMKRSIIFIVSILIAVASKGQILNGNLSGSLETNNIYYFDDEENNFQAPDNILGSNNYFKMDYYAGNVTAGLQYEAYLSPILGYSPFLEGNKLVSRYVQFDAGSLDVTVGSFFGQFGSGLIFRSYEERALGINTSMDGVKIMYTPFEFLRIKGIWGKQRKYLENGDGTVRGGDLDLDILSLLSAESGSLNLYLGGSWVNKYEPYTGADPAMPLSVDAYAARLKTDYKNVGLYVEFVEKTTDPGFGNIYSREYGNALLVNSSWAGKGIGVNVSLRSLKNMDFRSERDINDQVLMINYVPALTRQHKYALANLYPYAAQSRSEIGGQLDVYCKIPRNTFFGGKYGTKLALNAAYYQDLDQGTDGYYNFLQPGDKKLFQDINIEIDRKFTKSFKAVLTYINMHYNKGAVISGGDYTIKQNIAVVDMQYKVSLKNSFRAEIQHLWTEQDDGNWFAGLLEFNMAPHWSVFISDMYNYGVTDKHYINGGFSYAKGVTRISLSGGRNKEGFICAGGVCRYVPAYTGINLSLTTSF